MIMVQMKIYLLTFDYQSYRVYPAWQGSVVRMGDKYARISNFIKKGEFKFKEESIKDTLMDMAIILV